MSNRITEAQLRSIIRQEISQLNETYVMGGTGSALLDFAKYYAALDTKISSQIDQVITAYIRGNSDVDNVAFQNSVHSEISSETVKVAQELFSILSSSTLGSEIAAVLEALDAAAHTAG